MRSSSLPRKSQEPRRSRSGVIRSTLSPHEGTLNIPAPPHSRHGLPFALGPLLCYLRNSGGSRVHDRSEKDFLSLRVLLLDTDAMGDDELSMFQCGLCKRNFKRLDHLARHVRSRTLFSPSPLVYSLITEDMDG